ncbi:TPA: ABC transporter permease/substrate-binding protein [Streptococcus suis]|uniref:Periplasmic glycine betaine/choline-binding (Lipo)protein of an ABC transporter (Osmoprotectant binding protein) n=1 Tax=Streptococcus suis TaxID=1307 RepID=A0A116MRL6_STRSU|nr:ABC transporter permease/substrate-binding protein [Streptococcus suis]NQG68730.1 ABC transporter permease/substrate-binding protein [Streptococcus suis]NQG99540.1 ABC transporter permease/substrate-binding protein [Streptococcus suis]CYV49558.1 periplasmic glycine betaine/choline-binding (lipo)protein of an ABC transporter (osmoprotectant binding protein) [Streptococcus suis]CYV62254.1 periplasmic glycine betaine/choline-binding (lipo)protein of an ABC transporter (osmoprotectant binding pr
MNLFETFIERKDEWGIALFEHLRISLLALIIAIAIAVPLGLILSSKKRLTEWSLQITGIFQTIPSLALLGLFIPFMGIGTLPAVVALVIYAIFPILQGTLTGLGEIDPSLEEAATAFGMNKWEKLKKFKLALAMPILMSGIRTASIMIIGTATLAALVGAGGLGSFILLGIDRNDSALILIGAVSSAVLAVLFGYGIRLLQDKKPKTILLALLVTLFTVGASYVPMLNFSTKQLVIAGKLGAEPEILINMYKLLIEDRTDIKVEIKPNFGKTSFLYEALKSGSIDIYPEYTGTITSTLLKNSPTDLSTNPEEVYTYAKEAILEQDGLMYLAPMAFQNTYALAVTEDYAQDHGIEKISDLAKVQQTAVAGFSLEFNDREDGNIGLKNLYNLQLNVKTMEPALRYEAIKNGDVQIVEAFSTDSKVVTYKLKILEDDKQLFPPYQAAPLLTKETLEKYPELEQVLGVLAGNISTEEMTQMNYAVDVEGKSAEQVAREYLEQEGLLK